MATCRQIHIVSLPYSKTRPGLDAHITKRTAILLLLDIVATYAAYWLASLLTDVEGEVFVNNEIYFMLGILALINVAVLGLFHLYNNLWEYASVDEAIQIVLAVVLSTLVGAVFLWIIDVRLPIRVFFVVLHAHILYGRHPFDLPRHAPEKARARLHAAHVRPSAHARGGRGGDGLAGNRTHGLEGPAHAGHTHRGH